MCLTDLLLFSRWSLSHSRVFPFPFLFYIVFSNIERLLQSLMYISKDIYSPETHTQKFSCLKEILAEGVLLHWFTGNILQQRWGTILFPREELINVSNFTSGYNQGCWYFNSLYPRVITFQPFKMTFIFSWLASVLWINLTPQLLSSWRN